MKQWMLIKTSQGWVGPSSALAKRWRRELKYCLFETNENQVQFDDEN